MVPYEMRGKVKQILDGNTFILQLDPPLPEASTFSKGDVSVTLAHGMAANPFSLGGALAKLDLEKRLAGQYVSCEIVDSHASKNLTTNIHILNRKLHTYYE